MLKKTKKWITGMWEKNQELNERTAIIVAGCKLKEGCDCKTIGKVEDKIGRTGPDKIITATTICVKKEKTNQAF